MLGGFRWGGGEVGVVDGTGGAGWDGRGCWGEER